MCSIFQFANVCALFIQHLPTTMVSSGISSMKHFFSVSPIWKYNPDATEKTENRANANMLLVPILVQIHRMLYTLACAVVRHVAKNYLNIEPDYFGKKLINLYRFFSCNNSSTKCVLINRKKHSENSQNSLYPAKKIWHAGRPLRWGERSTCIIIYNMYRTLRSWTVIF